MKKVLTKGRLAALAQGLGAKEIARKIGISENYAVAILSGRMKPSREVLERLSKTLEIAPDEIQKPLRKSEVM